ncbi:hypothetical protein EIP86_000359 [Pleurotus ostreatoroseus]|nr:hypothetical protein EIP86_000359 [Pleurotus ostreatoroseus]
MTPETRAIKIAPALDKAIKDKLNFTGTMSFHRACPDAPNPCLEVSGLGPIGLPLNSREAQLIKASAEQVLCEKGERTAVDTSVRDTWQLDADKVAFRNHAWSLWLQNVVRDVCVALGVNYAASQPRCELYKFTLCGTGSQYLPHVDTEKKNGIFATIVIVLPSKFTGGSVHVSHGDTSAIYDCGSISDCHTSITACYTDVMREIRPITSGYRLALFYNVIHTTNSPRPALSDITKALDALRQVLLTWRAGAGLGVPEKILYLLEHTYTGQNLRGSALKDSDTQLVAILYALGQELGFSLGLASIDYSIEGAAVDYSANKRRKAMNPYWNGDSEDDDNWDDTSGPDEDQLSIAEVAESSITLFDFVDLNGEEFPNEIEISDTTETIPDDLEDSMTDRDYESQEYNRDRGYRGTVARWYRRTALVIWPTFAACLVTSDLDHACSKLKAEADRNGTATPEEYAITEFLLGRLTGTSKDASLVADAVCHAACRWQDPELWNRAVNKCSCIAGTMTLDVEDACKVFGLDTIKSSLETMLQHEPRNHKLFAWLKGFRTFNWEKFKAASGGVNHEDGDRNEDTTGAPTEDGFIAPVSEWIETQWLASLKDIREPTKEDFPTLSQLARDSSGSEYVRDSMLPQLSQKCDASTLRDFALYMNTDEGPAQDAYHSLQHDVASQILKASVAKLDIKLSTPTSSYTYSFCGPSSDLCPDPSVEVAKAYFEACTTLKCLDQAVIVAEKVASVSGQSATEAQIRAKSLILPFLTWVSELSAKRSDLKELPMFSVLQTGATTPVLDAISALSRDITREEFRVLMRTISLPGGNDMFAECILPKLDTFASSESSTKAIIEELQPRISRVVLPATYQGPSLLEIVKPLSKKYAQCVSIQNTGAIIASIDCCIRMQVPDEIWTIMDRILDPKKLKGHDHTLSVHHRDSDGVPLKDSTYVDRVIVPLMAQLRQLANKYNMLDVLAPAFRQIARTYVQQILGPIPRDLEKPLATIQHWLCGCAQCKEIRAFLLFKPERSIFLPRISAPKSKHIENYLRLYVTSAAASWQMASSSPQGITVTKTELLHESTLWRVKQRKAIKLVKDACPNEAERTRIYGEEYPEYAKWIKGIPASAITTSQQPGSNATLMPTNTTVTAGVRRPSGSEPSQKLPPAKRAKISGTPEVIDLT